MSYARIARLAAPFFLVLFATAASAGTLSLSLSGYPASIEVLAFKVGAVNAGSTSLGSGGGAGKATFSDFSLKAVESPASPQQLRDVAAGTHIQSARLTILSADGTRVISEWLMQDVLVTSLSVENGAEDPKAKSPNSFLAPVTTFTLGYGQVCYRVYAVDGSIARETCWNVAANASL